MQRRHFLFLASLLPPAMLAPGLLRARARQSPPTRNIADEANQIDELASNIHILPDARRLIDYIAEIFADELPPAWATESLRSRLAEGEYLSVTSPGMRIREEHLAAVWNGYISTIHAPDDSRVSVAEIHNLRDAQFVTARVLWKRGGRNIWAVPSIVAALPEGHSPRPAGSSNPCAFSGTSRIYPTTFAQLANVCHRAYSSPIFTSRRSKNPHHLWVTAPTRRLASSATLSKALHGNTSASTAWRPSATPSKRCSTPCRTP